MIQFQLPNTVYTRLLAASTDKPQQKF